MISHEEYTAYGATSLQTTKTDAVKRYRFTGKERDEETGFSDHGERYHVHWLGRWNSSDPIGLGDGINTFAYVRCNPVLINDPSGQYGEAGHYHTVYFASLAAGFDKDVAYANAMFAQMPDEVYSLDATSLFVDHAKSAASDWMRSFIAPESHDKYDNSRFIFKTLHSLTGGKAEPQREITEKALLSTKPGTMEFGFLLHRFGDSYAHTTLGTSGPDSSKHELYGPALGHALDGHSPDQIERRPKLYQSYAGDLYDTLRERAAADRKPHMLSREQFMEVITQVSETKLYSPAYSGNPWQHGELLEVDPSKSSDSQIRKLTAASLSIDPTINTTYQPDHVHDGEKASLEDFRIHMHSHKATPVGSQAVVDTSLNNVARKVNVLRPGTVGSK